MKHKMTSQEQLALSRALGQLSLARQRLEIAANSDVCVEDAANHLVGDATRCTTMALDELRNAWGFESMLDPLLTKAD